ncbi:hypothetical protein F4780DRAFT_272518 [Xylariomycetidae sp. FL0641]|nr:hypothetical protein F4780DRAFT_272518 [Xylariomycetidae sp. FL0641]
MRAFLLAQVACFHTLVLGTEFINPAPFSKAGDFSQNPVYEEGSTVNVAWTEQTSGKPSSVTFFQVNGTGFVQPFEIITENFINLTSFSWLVGTSKNLSFSNVFLMSIFHEGSASSDADSHYFNITARGASDGPPTSTGSAASSSPTSTLVPAAPTTAAAQPTESPTGGGLSAGAQIGVGVGVGAAAALLLGLLGAWIFLRRRRRGDSHSRSMAEDTALPPPPPPQETTKLPPSAILYGGSEERKEPVLVEVSGRQAPAEMPQPPQDPAKVFRYQNRYEVEGEGVRYELYAPPH